MSKAVSAIAGGLKDVLAGRLTLMALLNVVLAVALTSSAAWAAIHYLVPMIPDGSGWLANVSTAGEFIASVAIVVLAVALSPAASMVVGGLMFDFAAERVEKAIGAPRGRMVPLHQGIWNGVRIALPALFLNLIAIPFYFVPVVNAIVFWSLNAFLMGREYFTLAGARRMPFRDAVQLRKRNGFSMFMVGLACCVIPFLAPLVAASAMTRLINGLVASR
ncbi:MAG: EI24 domain-containing protein [Hyphomonadaceae bacterium]